MDQLLYVALAGFAASLVDGALGMGFGPTSSSILLGAGVSPVSTSTTVNLAKIVTGFSSGAAHWRAGNVDRRLVLRLAGPAAVGAVAGTLILTRVDAASIRPLLAGMLLLVGLRLLVRFSAPTSVTATDVDGSDPADQSGWGLRIVAATGGLSNGLVGAWGPVVTPYLLHQRVEPRTVVGSVNTAEIVVALVSAGSLIGALGTGGVELPIVLAMLGGGVLAAPVSAHVIKFIAPRRLGLAMASLLLITQTRELSLALGWPVGQAMLGAVVLAGAISTATIRIQRQSDAAGGTGHVVSAGELSVGVVDHGSKVRR